MKKRGLVIMGLLATGVVLVLCSCGGGGGGKRLTKEQFTAKANALCASFNKEDTAAQKGVDQNSMPQLVAYLEKMTPKYEKRVADFGKLSPPSGDQATVDRIVTIEKKQASLVEKVLAALKKNDTATAQTLSQSSNAGSAEAKSLYTKLGLTECLKTN